MRRWLLRGVRPGPLVEVAVVGVLAVGWLLEVALTVSRRPGWAMGGLDVLLSAGACLAAIRRRRHPVAGAVAAIACCAVAELVGWTTRAGDQPAAVACLAVLVVVVPAVRRLPGAAAAAVAAGSAVVALGTVGRYASYLDSGAPNAFTATRLMVAGWLVAVGLGLWGRWADLRREAVVATVRRDERLALARDLHDVAAHHLTGLIIRAQVGRLTAIDDPGSAAALADVEAAGTQALASLRDVVRLLRDEDDGAPVTPGPEPLADLVERFGRSGPRTTLRLPDGPLPATCPAGVATTVHRIAQEALTNVARHAVGAEQVTLTVTHDRDAVRLTVTDDGPSTRLARTPASTGHGLIGMRERAGALGGSLEAGPGPDGGWCVRAVLPTRSGS